MSEDRSVHAECENFAVVRYDRAGKWYVEPKVPGRARVRVSISEAAMSALSAETLGGTIQSRLPGGGSFDVWVARLRKRHGFESA